MNSEKISVRVGELREAAETRAIELGIKRRDGAADLSAYVRSLIAKDCGVQNPEMPWGFAAMPKELADKARAKARRTQRKRAKEKKRAQRRAAKESPGE